MMGIALFLVALFAMFGWFGYLVVKDPANLFKRRPPPGDDEPS
jgi:hypothetical protein